MAKETDEEYHANKAYLSSHRLAMFERNPAEFKDYMDGTRPETDSKAFALGRATHCMILEGMEEYEDRFTSKLPINPSTGRPYGSASDKYKNYMASLTRQFVSPSDYNDVLGMREAVSGHKEASALITGGEAEKIVRRELFGVDCQMRADYVKDNKLIDLKTIADIKWFESECKKFGYKRQMAFYNDMLGGDMECFFVVVEKKYPYRCGVWYINDLSVESQLNYKATQELIECRENNYYPTRYEEVRILS